MKFIQTLSRGFDKNTFGILFSVLLLVFLVACFRVADPVNPEPPIDPNIKIDTKAPVLTFASSSHFRARAGQLTGTVKDDSKIGTVRLFEADRMFASTDPTDSVNSDVQTIKLDADGNWSTEFKPNRIGEYNFRVVANDIGGLRSVLDRVLTVEESYNIVVLLTDDQNFDTLKYMPFMTETVMPQSLTFNDAIITTPVCCPARASLFSGFYPSNTGVLQNTFPNGTRRNFNEIDTVSVHMQEAGYNTGFIGKYLHGYSPGFIPPGWTSFVANQDGQIPNWLNLKNVTIGSSNSKGSSRGRVIPRINQHLISYHRDKSIEFLDEYSKQEDPFFLYISTYAPHPPAVPEEEDKDKFEDFFYRERAYGETDLSDKPRWVQNAANDKAIGQCSDFTRQRHLKSLQGADRIMEKVWNKVEAEGQLDRTIFIFTSDNGLTFGEHGISCDKGMGYEESVRVPLVIRMPDGAVGTTEMMSAVNVDFAATLYDLIGFEKQTDGLSLLPILKKEEPKEWRDYLPIDAYGYLAWKYDTVGIWSGIRTDDWKYIETADDINELYNLKDDPFEQENLISSGQHADVITDMTTLLDKHRGLAITTFTLPEALRGQPYQGTLTAWGGAEPYTWSVSKGKLPDGLVLNAQEGKITGVPTRRGTYKFTIRVTSPKLAVHRGKEQQFFFDYALLVK